MMTAIVVLAASVYMTFHWIKGLKRRSTRENVVQSLLLLIAIGLGCMHLLKLPVPNPLNIITALFTPAAKMLQAIFK
jgi:uncharacterized protein (DUF486 family)